MGVIISPVSDHGKELQKWEQFPSHWNGEVIPAGNPYVKRDFPKMLYKAFKKGNGKVVCMEPPPNPHEFLTAPEFDRAAALSEAFNKSCQKIVASESEMRVAMGQGWAESPNAALERFEAQESDIARAAAEANFTVQRMTEQAKAEHKAADLATHEHVVDVVGGKRGPKAKTE